MAERVLKSVYATDMDFEPDERRMTIGSDGIVSLQVTHTPGAMFQTRISINKQHPCLLSFSEVAGMPFLSYCLFH